MLRRLVQTVSLGLFVYLLWITVAPLRKDGLSVELFMRLDPSVSLIIPLTLRKWLPELWPGLALLGLTFFAGRVFCGYLCPMGNTLDAGGWASRKILAVKGIRRPGGKRSTGSLLVKDLPKLKYLVLAGVAGSALIGLNLLFWVAPMPLAARLYTYLAHPGILSVGSQSLDLFRPHAESLGLGGLTYAQIASRGYDTALYILLFFLLLFFLERVKPRSWCRYLCPAGALFALCSAKPAWRRRVRACSACGRCAQVCPTGALTPQGSCSHSECIACQSCAGVCPLGGIYFGLRERPIKTLAGQRDAPEQGNIFTGRRIFLASAASGLFLVSSQLSDLGRLSRSAVATSFPQPVRPPGSVPESAFLQRCIRCGACMKVCPTNALQPAWFHSGFNGMFSPVVSPARGPCEPECVSCGNSCPTGAIRSLILDEKLQAKIGTALVIKEYCLAWSGQKRCVVCEEVCPYGAVACVQAEGVRGIPVPVVKSLNCYGCGYCEKYCPVEPKAIIINPSGEIRLGSGSYQQSASRLGVRIRLSGLEEGYNSGFDELQEGELPPGFTD